MQKEEIMKKRIETIPKSHLTLFTISSPQPGIWSADICSVDSIRTMQSSTTRLDKKGTLSNRRQLQKAVRDQYPNAKQIIIF